MNSRFTTRRHFGESREKKRESYITCRIDALRVSDLLCCIFTKGTEFLLDFFSLRKKSTPDLSGFGAVAG